MSRKKLIWFGIVAGSTIGGFVPMLWHAGLFSLSSVLFSTIGGVAGIWVGYRLSQYL